MNLLHEALCLLVRLRQVRALDRLRAEVGPRRAVELARRLGERARCRNERERAVLRRLIAIIDRRWKTGPNCYRRVLLEVAMDRGAAAELVQLGFQRSGEPGSGHAWLGSGLPSDDGSRSYDAIVAI